MASQIERQIREALAAHLALLPWLRKVEPFKIRNGFSELHEHEVPFVQFYGIGQDYVADRTELTTTWNLAIDLVLRQGSDGLIDQRDLDDKRQELIEHIGAGLEDRFGNLAIIQVVPINATDDLNTYEPFFLTTVTFQWLYRKPFIRPC